MDYTPKGLFGSEFGGYDSSLPPPPEGIDSKSPNFCCPRRVRGRTSFFGGSLLEMCRHATIEGGIKQKELSQRSGGRGPTETAPHKW
uniref:Uncharacterized protein n=1 Tax=Globodera rostochiensis TaxID=31243 RepID=A0A914HBT1_GLORO